MPGGSVTEVDVDEVRPFAETIVIGICALALTDCVLNVKKQLRSSANSFRGASKFFVGATVRSAATVVILKHSCKKTK